jgi:hypothetical protein
MPGKGLREISQRTVRIDVLDEDLRVASAGVLPGEGEQSIACRINVEAVVLTR